MADDGVFTPCAGRPGAPECHPNATRTGFLQWNCENSEMEMMETEILVVFRSKPFSQSFSHLFTTYHDSFQALAHQCLYELGPSGYGTRRADAACA